MTAHQAALISIQLLARAGEGRIRLYTVNCVVSTRLVWQTVATVALSTLCVYVRMCVCLLRLLLLLRLSLPAVVLPSQWRLRSFRDPQAAALLTLIKGVGVPPKMYFNGSTVWHPPTDTPLNYDKPLPMEKVLVG